VAGFEPYMDRIKRVVRLALATILHGVGTGAIGIGIALMIRQVQVLGFGDGEGGFLEIAVAASPARRMLSVFVGGVFGAGMWYWLRGRETTIVTVEESLKGAKMPPGVTLLNGMVQDIVVALGGSFGREAAPREIAAMWGGVLADNLGVSDKEERRLLVACGTGAGLAAVYSVPISGTLYTLEHVLNWDLSLRNVLCASATAVIATITASVVVEGEGLYVMPKYSYEWPKWEMLLWSAIIGPFAGLGAIAFRRLVKFFEGYKPAPRMQANFKDLMSAKSGASGDRVWLNLEGSDHRTGATLVEKSSDHIAARLDGEPEGSKKEYTEDEWDDMNPEGDRNWHILVLMPIAFLVLGGLSVMAPSLLGNGRALAEIAIKRDRTMTLFVMLIFLKATCTASAIGSGAAGGTLTPSVALGATLGTVVGEMYQYLLPHLAPQEGCNDVMSIIAAAAFLSIMLKSPVSSLWLMMEFAAQGVRQEDLMALLHGDYQGLVQSKLCVGMLLPLGIAIATANGTTKVVNLVYAWMWPPKVKQRQVAPEDRVAVKDLSKDQQECREAFVRWRAVYWLAALQRDKRNARRRKTGFDLDLNGKEDADHGDHHGDGYAALKDFSRLESIAEDEGPYKKMGP